MGPLSTALARLVGRPAAPDGAPPSGPVILRFVRKYCEPGGSVFNVGEVAGWPASRALRLVAEGYARRVGPDARPEVRPRPTDETTWTLAGQPLDTPAQWHSSARDDQWSSRRSLDDRGIWR